MTDSIRIPISCDVVEYRDGTTEEIPNQIIITREIAKRIVALAGESDPDDLLAAHIAGAASETCEVRRLKGERNMWRKKYAALEKSIMDGTHPNCGLWRKKVKLPIIPQANVPTPVPEMTK